MSSGHFIAVRKVILWRVLEVQVKPSVTLSRLQRL